MPDPVAALALTLERLLNRELPHSPRARRVCQELAGRRALVEVQAIAAFIVECTVDGLRISRAPSGASADVRICGGAFSLLALLGPSADATVRRGGVLIEGDAELAERLRTLAGLLRPDLEEEAARWIGDVPAHRLGRLTRSLAGWARETALTSATNLAEYLAHERRDVVPALEADDLFRGVDTLREDIDRLAARIDLLARRTTPTPGQPPPTPTSGVVLE